MRSVDCNTDDLLFFIFLDHTVSMILGGTQYFRHIVCGFGINIYPGQYGNAFGYGCQMVEEGRCSIGFSNVIDGTHHGLQVLQDLHIDR